VQPEPRHPGALHDRRVGLGERGLHTLSEVDILRQAHDEVQVRIRQFAAHPAGARHLEDAFRGGFLQPP